MTLSNVRISLTLSNVYVTEVKPGDAVETNPMGGDGVVRMSTGQEEGQ